jgi:phosphomannomutase
LSREQKSLSQVILPLKKYGHSGEINFEIQDKEAALTAIKEAYASHAVESVVLDGLWYRFDWGWVSVRTSNTEPVVRLNLETFDPDSLQEKIAEFSAVLASFE